MFSQEIILFFFTFVKNCFVIFNVIYFRESSYSREEETLAPVCWMEYLQISTQSIIL